MDYQKQKIKQHLFMHKTEARIQQEIVLWFRNNYCLKHHKPRNIIFSVPNESQNVQEAGYKKAIGLMKGVSDLIMVLSGEVIFIEVKTEKGRQSKEQIEFQECIEALGFRYMVVRSLEDFKEKIERRESLESFKEVYKKNRGEVPKVITVKDIK